MLVRAHNSLVLFSLLSFLLDLLDGLLPLKIDDPLLLEILDPTVGTILLKFFIFRLALGVYTLAVLGVHCIQDIRLV